MLSNILTLGVNITQANRAYLNVHMKQKLKLNMPSARKIKPLCIMIYNQILNPMPKWYRTTPCMFTWPCLPHPPKQSRYNYTQKDDLGEPLHQLLKPHPPLVDQDKALWLL
jgi:hypothetical protein